MEMDSPPTGTGRREYHYADQSPARNIPMNNIPQESSSSHNAPSYQPAYQPASRPASRGTSGRAFGCAFLTISAILLAVVTVVAPILIGKVPGFSAQPAIAIDTHTVTSHLSPLFFGQDLYYPDAGKTVYADAAQTTYDPGMLSAVRGLSPTILRCGGGLDSEWYHWVDGIGPLSSRPPTRLGMNGTIRVDNFGTDDCLQYAETIGAAAIQQVDTNDYPVSSANRWNPQATPDEAAALVAYVNGSPTDTRSIGVDEHGTDWKTVGYWAEKRIENGHPDPYKVTYFEVGNEDYGFSGENGIQYGNRFLQFAQAMKRVDPTIKTGAVLFNDEPNNIWNTQVPQVAKSEIDFTIDHDYPMGDNSMLRFFNPVKITRTIRFPVEATKSYTISMNAITFHGISGLQPDSQMIFTIDGKSFKQNIAPGQYFYHTLTFTVPGSQLSTTGRHTVTIQLLSVQRYVDIYKDILVNGDTYPLFSQQEIYENLLVTLEKVNWYIDGLQSTTRKAGLPGSVPLFVTEYNLAFSPTTNKPMYSASVMTALLLMKYIQHGVGMASMFVLSQPTPQHWNAIASDDSNPNARVHWRYPQAYGFEIIRKHTGTDLLGSIVTNSPTIADGIPALNVVATIDPKAHMLHIIVSNSSYNQALKTNLNIEEDSQGGPVTVTTLNAPSLTSTSNSPTDSQITITSRDLNSMPAYSTYTFPAHSITTFDIQMSS